MDIDQFWDLIERARTTVGPAADQALRDFDNPEDEPDRDYWDFEDLELDPELLAGIAKGDPSAALENDENEDRDEGEGEDEGEEDDDEDDVTDPVTLALIEQLEQLPAAEIAAFEQIFETMRGKAGRDDIANAAVLIEHGFLGDDSFEDFRAGLVALGRSTYDAVLTSPDALADHPIVREIAQANDPRWLGRESLLYAASHAYATVTGEDEISFYDFVESLYPDEEPELPADGPEWEITDEAATRRHLPRLAALFYERSMTNRSRAMQKLGLNN